MILLAPDKFKGSLSAEQVCSALEQGLHQLSPSEEIVSHPMADGGEGTAGLLTWACGGVLVRVNVLDPLFRTIESEYGISADGTTAFIEMAKASGLQLLKAEERNPLITSSIGTGQLIVDALNRNVRRIILGVGGTATNDAGMGMATALGYQFLDSDQNELKPTGENLIRIHTVIRKSSLAMQNCQLTILNDVSNPLYGKEGAAFVFAQQKGATPQAVLQLDKGLMHLAEVIQTQFGVDIRFEGAGAGGGIPAMAKLLFPRVEFAQGIEFIIQFTNLETHIRHASLIITGEGKIDSQTLTGKVVKGIAQLCAKHSKPCIAFAGLSELSEKQLRQLGVSQVITLMDKNTDEKAATGNAFSLLQKRVMEFLPALLRMP